MKLWQCSNCGKVGFWSEDWSCYTSLMIDDEWPSYRLVICSDACKTEADARLKTGELALPKIRGFPSTMSKGPVGYKPQPEQRELLALWNRQNAKHLSS